MDKGPKVGAEVVFADTVTTGDYVYFEHSRPDRVIVHRLDEWEARSFEGTVYRIEAGDEPDTIGIRHVTAEELG